VEKILLPNTTFIKDPVPPAQHPFSRMTIAQSSDVVLISVHENFYRLLLRIKTPNHWRVVDLSDAMNSVIRTIPVHKCLHESKGPEVVVIPTKCYTFEELLGRWPDAVQSMSTDRYIIDLSSSLDGRQRRVARELIQLTDVDDTCP
jgi:hypothetical protein